MQRDLETMGIFVGHWSWLAIVAASLAAGCSQGPAVGTVNGDVTFDGVPVKDGRVLFTPLDGKGATGGASIVDGKFTAEVPVAKMKVEINGNKLTGRKIKAYDTPESPVFDEVVELIPPKYNFNTELSLDVQRGNQDVKYELKSK